MWDTIAGPFSKLPCSRIDRDELLPTSECSHREGGIPTAISSGALPCQLDLRILMVDRYKNYLQIDVTFMTHIIIYKPIFCLQSLSRSKECRYTHAMLYQHTRNISLTRVAHISGDWPITMEYLPSMSIMASSKSSCPNITLATTNQWPQKVRSINADDAVSSAYCPHRRCGNRGIRWSVVSRSTPIGKSW